MNEPRTLLVRCDASVAIGTGHAMRCLALAQAWQDAGGHVVFAMLEATSAVEDRLHREGIEVARLRAEVGSADDARETIMLAATKQASWVVVDGYKFDANLQTHLKEAGHKVLLVDDTGGAAHYSADLVLNQNVCANEMLRTPARICNDSFVTHPRLHPTQ
jgi:UDP-2,4-diacetamido-2,4,6-trideoxy-beta-L-altropyranose hydrolase